MISGDQPRVLIVDDDENFTFLLHKAFRKSGIESVTSVSNGGEAARYVSGISSQMDRSPDLIIVDLNMAGIGGFEFLGWLQRNPLHRHIPVIVLSGTRNPAEREKSVQLGAREFYEKPFGFEELKALVANHLSKWIQAPQTDNRRDVQLQGKSNPSISA